MYKQYLAVNNLKKLTCPKIQPTNQPIFAFTLRNSIHYFIILSITFDFSHFVIRICFLISH